MGGTSWSDDSYTSRAAYRTKTNTPAFAHSDAISRGATPAKVHDKLDPAKLKAGARESRDSDAHPESNSVFVGFDVTGSMAQVPEVMQKSLCSLMGLLLRKSYLTDPAICVAGIGDATCDRAPLQVGQFESGIEIENDLTNLYLEKGGGGQKTESYELALYFLARKTICDCWEKRKKKGYAFIIGDEMAYGDVKRGEVKTVFGDDLEANIPLSTIIDEVKQKWELYYILPNLTSYYNDPTIIEFWRKHLGQYAMKLEDPNGISETIASIIGVSEGAVDIGGLVKDLCDSGTSSSVANSVSKAVTVVGSGGGAVSTLSKGTGLATL